MTNIINFGGETDEDKTVIKESIKDSIDGARKGMFIFLDADDNYVS